MIIVINCEISLQNAWPVQADGPRLHSLLEQPFALARKGCPVRGTEGGYDSGIYAVVPAD